MVRFEAVRRSVPHATPIVGTTLAELVATGRTPDLIAPFALERFYQDTLVSELAAAAVSH